MAEVTKVQNELVSFTMYPTAPTIPNPKNENGAELQQTHFPVQLYCRARPWLQVRGRAQAGRSIGGDGLEIVVMMEAREGGEGEGGAKVARRR